MELPWLVNFFLMFYNDKPGENSYIYKEGSGIWVIESKHTICVLSDDNVLFYSLVDWLLENLIQTKVCKLDQVN